MYNSCFFSQVKGPSSAVSVVPPSLRRATYYATSNFTLERNPSSVTCATMPAAEEMLLLDTFAHTLVAYTPPEYSILLTTALINNLIFRLTLGCYIYIYKKIQTEHMVHREKKSTLSTLVFLLK